MFDLQLMAQGFVGIVSPFSLVLMALGVFCGAVFGAIPGLTGGIAIAILLPLTFKLEAIPAMALLIGVYVGGAFGGSIPAILFGTPGAPEASVTSFDGYPMMKKGLGGKALKTALYASCAGNFLASIITISMMVGVSKLALMMDAPDYFGVVVFSIVLIATIGCKESWIKGLIAVLLGLMFSFIGGDPLTGTLRFTFGNRFLMSGLDLIPVLIGLFVGAEVLSEAGIKRERNLNTVSEFKENNKITKHDVQKCIPSVLSGTLIGSIIGALPGLNAAISSTLNYSFVQKISKDPQSFGEGNIVGVAAAEAANNATAGPTLVPLLTLGIPGSGTAAIFLGALTIQGIVPGPTIFRDAGDVVYGIFFALMLCTVILAVIGRGLISIGQYISFIPTEMLNPVIILTCCAGAFSVNNRISDVFILLLFMAIGYFMRVLHIPSLPLLIAFLLGGMLESNLRRSLLMSGGSFTVFFTAKFSAFFLGLSLLMILYTILQPIVKKRHKKSKEVK
jgi:putative tricarboxylic transport membrane protein